MRSNPPSLRVLIGFAETLAALECCYGLQQFGIEVVAFARKNSRTALRRHHGVTVVDICPPEVNIHRCCNEIVDLVTSAKATAVMPLDDAAVWACNQIATRITIPIVGPTGNTAELALDKWAQIQAATAAGLLILPTKYCANVQNLPDHCDFPIVLKPVPAIAVRGEQMFRPSGSICANLNELTATVQRWPEGIPALIQPYIEGIGSGLFGFVQNSGQPTSWSAHRRLRMMNPHGSGASACTPAAVDKQLMETAARFLTACRWSGMFMFEFLNDDQGQPWFMELNGRAWGSMALSRRLGLEYAYWCVAQALGLEIQPVEASNVAEFRCRHLGREILHLLAVMRGPRSAAMKTWPSRWQTALDVLTFKSTDRWYNWTSGTFTIFLRDAMNTVLSQALRRRAE